MPVLTAALDEGAAVRLILERGIDLPLLTVPGDTVPFEDIADGRPTALLSAPRISDTITTLRIELDHARLDDNPPCPKAARSIGSTHPRPS